MAPKKKKPPKPPAEEPTAAADADDGADETPAQLKTRANALVAKGDHKAAAALLTRAIGKGPSDLHLYHSNRSLCALSLQDYGLAIEDANKCIALQPEWPKGYSRLGAALFFSGKASEASKAYAKGLAIEPTNEVRVRVRGGALSAIAPCAPHARALSHAHPMRSSRRRRCCRGCRARTRRSRRRAARST